MKQIDDYVRAAVRDSTRRSYRDAVTHFEDGWGGLLPATADSVAQYLATHAETLSHNTLKRALVQITSEPAQSGIFTEWVHAAKTAAQISDGVCP